MIYIADSKILSIQIKECREPLIDIKEYGKLLYGPPPECELTKNCYTKMRLTVYKKLCAAQKKLPNNWRFRLYEGFRSFEVQQLLFEQEYKRTASRINGNHEEIFRETTRLISPVINLDGSKNIPPHNTGGAIDIEIISADGKLVDMGMSIKDWTLVDPDLCLTDCDNINETAKENRQLLLKIMNDHEFVNYPNEWWHFSYGDRYWAYHQYSKLAIYDAYEKEC